MPCGMERAKNKAPQQGAVLLLQSRQRESPPTRFFPKCSDEIKRQEVWQVRGEDQRPLLDQGVQGVAPSTTLAPNNKTMG